MSSQPITFSVRRAGIDDSSGLRAMQAASVRALATGSYSQAEIEGFLTHVGTMDEQLIAEGTYYVIEAGGQIVASGGWSRLRANYINAPHGSPAPDRPVARLRSMYVHPDWARHGFATRLMQRAESEAFLAGFTEMELNAMLSGVPFYTALWYSRVRPVAVSLPDGVIFRGVTMRKALTAEAARVPATSGVVENRPHQGRHGEAA